MAQNKVVGAGIRTFSCGRFYEDAASLAKMVAGFVAEGLITGQPAHHHRHARASARHQPAADRPWGSTWIS